MRDPLPTCSRNNSSPPSRRPSRTACANAVQGFGGQRGQPGACGVAHRRGVRPWVVAGRGVRQVGTRRGSAQGGEASGRGSGAAAPVPGSVGPVRPSRRNRPCGSPVLPTRRGRRTGPAGPHREGSAGTGIWSRTPSCRATACQSASVVVGTIRSTIGLGSHRAVEELKQVSTFRARRCLDEFADQSGVGRAVVGRAVTTDGDEGAAVVRSAGHAEYAPRSVLLGPHGRGVDGLVGAVKITQPEVHDPGGQ